MRTLMLWNSAQRNWQIVGNQQRKRIICLVPHWRLAYSAYMLALSNQAIFRPKSHVAGRCDYFAP